MSTNANYHPVLKSKTCRPPQRREFVRRTAIIERLNAGVTLPVTLVSAATGYGKSVAVSQWLEEVHYKYGWISLDDEHNNISIFIAYLLAVLKDQWPDEEFYLERLGSADLPVEVIASTVVADLEKLEDLFVLVLDDYQLIHEEKIHDCLNTILRHPLENFHLVILTQQDPPLKLARLRAQFQLNEVRMQDLAFTDNETIELGSLLSTNTQVDQLKSLNEVSEGWVTGITAVLMGLAEGLDFDDLIQLMNSRNSVISDLLGEVVIQGLAPKTQKYLALTSLVDRFSVELINAMISSIDDNDLSEEGTEEFISVSKERNLFLIPLDPLDQWYRYHHFFRSQIHNHVAVSFSEEQVKKIYSGAGQWFQAQNLLEEAVEYSILSGNMEFAVNVFNSQRIELHNSEQFQRLEMLIQMFPKDVIERKLELLLSLALLQDHKANFRDMQLYVDQAGQILENITIAEDRFNRLKGQWHSARAYLHFMHGDFEAAIDAAQLSRELLPALEPNYFREFAVAYYALGTQAIGKAKVAVQAVAEELEGPIASDQYFRGRLLHIKSLIYLTAGDAIGAGKSGVQLQYIHSPQSYPSAWMAGMYAATTSAYISNKLPEVHRFHDELVKYRFTGRPFGVIHHLLIECMASVAVRKWDEVDSVLTLSREFARDIEIRPLEGLVYAFEVEKYLAQNDLEHAIEVASLANFQPHPPLWYYYIPQLTEVKLLLRTDESIKAIELLNDLIEHGRRCNNENLLIQAYALRAVILEEEGKHQTAIEVLINALTLSTGKDHFRTYIDHGALMINLLHEIVANKSENKEIRDFVRVVLGEGSANAPESVGRRGYGNIVLSNRELQILLLVDEGYSNKEIAKKLFVSLDTVKKHLYHSFQKLHVKNRTAALKKAKELGLITVV